MQPLTFISIFILSLAILTSFTDKLYEKIVESDLEQKIESVTDKHFDSSIQDPTSSKKPSLTLTGQQLTVDTSHLPLEKANAYLKELDEIYGIYIQTKEPLASTNTTEQTVVSTQVDNNTEEIIPEQPITENPVNLNSPHFTLTENLQADTIVITGEIASANERELLINSLSTETNYTLINELIINEELTTITNRERLFQLCADFLTVTQNSSIEWTPQQIRLGGEMKSEEAVTEMREQFASLFSDDVKIITTSLHLIKAPSLDFTLERLSNNTIILKGTLPSKEMGDALYQLVAKSHTASIGLNNKSYIANNLRYTDQENSAWWFGIPEAFIGDFLKQTEGIAKIEYTKSGLYIEGIYKKQDEFIRARSTFQAIPQHLDVYDDFLRFKGQKKENKTLPLEQPELQDTSSSNYNFKF